MFKLLDFLHNGVVHPLCALVWGLGDLAGMAGWARIAAVLGDAGMRLHNLGFRPSNPPTHAQAAHHARFADR